MDKRTQKLAQVLRDKGTAAALVEIDLDTPAKIKKAKDTDLRKARGVGPAKLAEIRKRAPKAE